MGIDRSALVERIGVTAIAHSSYVDERDVDLRAGTGNDGETWGDLARSIGEAAITEVEAAGWGPRAEPVAGTGEVLALLVKAAEAGIHASINARDGDMSPGVAAWEEAVIAARSWTVAAPEPLSAEEVAEIADTIKVALQSGLDFLDMAHGAVAALPARFAVAVEQP